MWLAIAWGLVNWVPHTALHMNHGNIENPNDFGGRIAIECGFHATLIIAAAAVAQFFVRTLRMGTTMTQTTMAPAAKAKAA